MNFAGIGAMTLDIGGDRADATKAIVAEVATVRDGVVRHSSGNAAVATNSRPALA